MQPILPVTHVVTQEDYQRLQQKKGNKERFSYGLTLFVDTIHYVYYLIYTDEENTMIVASCLSFQLADDMYESMWKREREAEQEEI